MPPPSDPRLLVLHGLQLKGHAMAAALAETIDLPLADVERELRGAGRRRPRRRAHERTGRVGADARRVATPRPGCVADEVDAAGARPAVADAYGRFRALNAAVLDACSRWQVRDVAGTPVLNDHRDARYDDGRRRRPRPAAAARRPRGRRPGRHARPLPHLRAPPAPGAGQGRGRRRRLVHQAVAAELPHCLVRAARGPADDARPRPQRRVRRRQDDATAPAGPAAR